MINKQTILPTFDEKLTLLQWLKKVEQGLAEGVLRNCEIVKTARSSFKFKLTFEDDSVAESNVITLEGNNIVSASFVQGRLIFTLEDGSTIDAGLLSGNLGNVVCEVLEVHGDVHVDGDIYTDGDIEAGNVIELQNVLQNVTRDAVSETIKVGDNLEILGGLQMDSASQFNGIAIFEEMAVFNGGVDLPSFEHLKSAQVSEDGNTLTLKNQQDEEIVFEPSGGGISLYQHNVLLTTPNNFKIFITLVNKDRNAYSREDFLSKLVNIGSGYLNCNGYCKSNSGTHSTIIYVSNPANGTTLSLCYVSSSEGFSVRVENITNSTIDDKVIIIND